MNNKLENDIYEAILYLFRQSKNYEDFLSYTTPWKNTTDIKTLSLRAIFEIF